MKLKKCDLATALILDLDGVLITTRPWKTDEIHQDGYSNFNAESVKNLNKLFQVTNFEIWLSSTRRIKKSLEEFNQIFQNRNIEGKIKGFLPVHEQNFSRRKKVEYFIEHQQLDKYLIIDDDKSLNDLADKSKLILTNYLQGFNREKLLEAKEKVIT